jgi:zinc protease
VGTHGGSFAAAWEKPFAADERAEPRWAAAFAGMMNDIMPWFFPNRASRTSLLALMAMLVATASAQPATSANSVLKATLANGLQVVIVRNTIGPVVSTDLTYLVGSRDDPADVPGMAHAQEHMMFRGTVNLSTSELGTVATALGGDFNAATTDTTTHYQFTVPAADLDAVLRIESDRMRDVLDAQSQWENERGAIEQEVLRDQSEPGNDFFRDAQLIAFAHTPYGHEGVGTRASFDRLTGPRIKEFYRRWYAPNNAVLVVAGDVDPAQTLEQIRARFATIPRRTIPAHAVAHFAPLRRTVLARPTTLTYPLAAVGYRLPGVDSSDFLAAFVLQGILDSQRGPLRSLVDSGAALDAEWVSLPYVDEAQLAFATAALRPGADPGEATRQLERILSGYAHDGIPRELFETTKRRLITGQEESRNSIEALASDWATTIAVDREPSIAREQELIANVTLADVNRVAQKYFRPQEAIIGALTPSANATQNAPAAPPQQGPEKPLGAQPPVTHLPEWASRLVDHIVVPNPARPPDQMKLDNGITLVVQPETISDSVFVFGSVKSNPVVQEPVGKEGVSLVLSAMFEYGTATQDRLTFARAQDDADSDVSSGVGFGLQTTSREFARGVALLAQAELQPRFDEATFELARQRAAEELQTDLNGSNSIANHRAAAFLLPAGDPELRTPTVAGVEALTLDDVKAYYAKTIRPDLTTIVVAGNVSSAAARAAIDKEFGAWHASGAVPDVRLAPLPVNPPGEVRLSLPVGQDSVMLRQIVDIARTDPHIYALLLGNAILGGGSLGPEQSRLFRELRQNAGLVYSIASRLEGRRERYELSIEFACLPSNEARISELIVAEIKRLQTQPAGSFELALAKASTIRQSVIADSSIDSIGQALLDDAANGLPFDQRQRDAENYLRTDAAAIQSAFAAYIHPQNFVRVIEGP